MNHPHNQTPLARLSPSSEISHNTPRILTLGDLSGKPLPPNLLSEQGRGLGSPISHVSSDRRSHGMNQDGRRSAGHLSQHQSRNSPRGLTSENVARFNNQARSTPGIDRTTPLSGADTTRAATKNSTLVNTLDLVSMGSESRGPGGRKVPGGSSNFSAAGSNCKTPTIDVGDSSSNSSEGDNDSFTCSEFECDSNNGDLASPQGNTNNRVNNRLNGGHTSTKDILASNGGDISSGGAMVFSKLIDMGPDSKDRRKNRSRSNRRHNNYHSSDGSEEMDDDDEEELDHRIRSRPNSTTNNGGARSWEHLLTWWPDYESFAGVFKDIAELPHESLEDDLGADGNSGGGFSSSHIEGSVSVGQRLHPEGEGMQSPVQGNTSNLAIVNNLGEMPSVVPSRPPTLGDHRKIEEEYI